MASSITTIVQKTECGDIDSVFITDIVPDGENFVREIRVFGQPILGGTKPLLFTLRLSGSTEQSVKLSAPIQSF